MMGNRVQVTIPFPTGLAIEYGKEVLFVLEECNAFTLEGEVAGKDMWASALKETMRENKELKLNNSLLKKKIKELENKDCEE